jgi:hypothetical protein
MMQVAGYKMQVKVAAVYIKHKDDYQQIILSAFGELWS